MSSIRNEEENEIVEDEDEKANEKYIGNTHIVPFIHCLVSLFFSGNVHSAQIKYTIF